MSRASLARSLKAFVDQISNAPKDTRSVRKVISEAFSIAESSPEMQLLLYIQVENFERLLTQVKLSSIQDEAKSRYLHDIGVLAGIVNHPRLFNRYDTTRAEVIEPYSHTLTYVDDALKVGVDIEQSITDDADQLAEQLASVLDELKQSDLPLKVRAILHSQIFQLIFLLNNFRIVGVEKVWEAAAATYVTIQKEANTIDAAGKTGVLKSVAVGIAALVGILSMVDSGVGHAVGIVTNLQKGIKLIDGWRSQSLPRIEHKPSSSIDESVDT